MLLYHPCNSIAGGLDVKILPRTANLEGGGGTSGPPPEQDIPLDIPKRTAVYIEQVSLHSPLNIIHSQSNIFYFSLIIA